MPQPRQIFYATPDGYCFARISEPARPDEVVHTLIYRVPEDDVAAVSDALATDPSNPPIPPRYAGPIQPFQPPDEPSIYSPTQTFHFNPWETLATPAPEMDAFYAAENERTAEAREAEATRRRNRVFISPPAETAE
jgi:hypothetical protein